MDAHVDPGPRGPLLHARQFVTGPAPVRIAGWSAFALTAATHVSHDPGLAVATGSDAGGRPWALFGHAVETRPARSEPVAALEAGSVDHPDITFGWAGRWVLVTDRSVLQDPTGLLGVYHGGDGTDVWASSSPALAAEAIGLGEPDDLPEPVAFGGLRWLPPPRTRWRSLHRLSATQELDLSTGTAVPRRLPPVGAIGVDRSFDELVDETVDALTRSIAGIPLGDEPLWVSLSAGIDSRTVFAVALGTGLPLRAFTRLSRRMSVADRILPRRLAAAVGVDHVYLPPARTGDRTAVMDAHCAGHVSRFDGQPFLRGERDDLRGFTAGGQVGLGGASWYGRLPAGCGDRGEAIRRIARTTRAPLHLVEDAFTDWFEWSGPRPLKGVDWRDRFHLEQRLGGWLSAKEQLYDASPAERVFAASSAHVHTLLLSFDEAVRRDKAWAHEIVARCAPALVEFPANPPDRWFGRARAVVTRFEIRRPRLRRRVRTRTAPRGGSVAQRATSPSGDHTP